MIQPAQGLPRCPICTQLLIERERGADQQHLPTEVVCRNFDCLDFGIYKAPPPPPQRRGPSAVPGAFLG
jgi:hypothetical protein